MCDLNQKADAVTLAHQQSSAWVLTGREARPRPVLPLNRDVFQWGFYMLVRAVLAAVGCAALVATTAVSAEATSPLQFGRIQYNSPGTDRATNVSVNGEYVVIKNLGTTARSLTGWTVRDAQNHVYKFGTFTLGAHKSVVLRTGKGTNTSTTRYWGLGWHVWNNTGDKAYLRTAAGTGMDSCAWTTSGPGYKNC